MPCSRLANNGVDTAILHATPDGEEVYPRLGFQEYCRISRFLGGR